MKYNADSKDLEEMAQVQSKLKQVRLVEKLGKQSLHNDTRELSEPITKSVTDSNQNLIEETKSTTKALRNWMNQLLM